MTNERITKLREQATLRVGGSMAGICGMLGEALDALETERASHAAEIVKAKRLAYEDAAEIVYTNNYDGIIEGTVAKIVDDIMAAAEAECGPPEPKEETPPPTDAQLSKAYDEIKETLP